MNENYLASEFLNNISSDIMDSSALKHEEEWDAFVEEYSGNPDYPDPVEYFAMLCNTVDDKPVYTELASQAYNHNYNDLECYEDDDLPF